MSLLGTVREMLEASTTTRVDDESAGAYWCHDCEERRPDVDVEGPEPPSCPSCGEEMEFERSVGTTGCAC